MVIANVDILPHPTEYISSSLQELVSLPQNEDILEPRLSDVSIVDAIHSEFSCNNFCLLTFDLQNHSNEPFQVFFDVYNSRNLK